MSNKKNLDPEEAKERAVKVSGTYQDYLAQLKGLREQQRVVIDEVVERIEKEKIEDIKKSLED